MLASSVVYANPRVSIILDDMGYRSSDKQAFELPTHVTFAILPHTEQSEIFALKAHEQGRTVMLHLPMETLQPRNLGPGALLASMDAGSISRTLDEALLTVPGASGVNNHMGSKLTQLTFPMTTLMHALVKRDLFFVDSRTTRFTKAKKIAQQTGVPALQRRVFLDHEISEDFITAQFERLIRLSHKHGYAIGIAHPHPLTVNTLNKLLAEEQATTFVAVDELLPVNKAIRYANQRRQQSDKSQTKSIISDLSPAN